MEGAVDDFVQELKKQIIEETKAAYGEIAYQRWRNPLFKGAMDNPDAFARLSGGCGDTMEIYLKFENNRVKEASYQTDGCGSSNVCGSFAAEMSIGRSPDQLLEITEDAISEKVGGLPKDDEQCALLAAQTIHMALNAWLNRPETPDG
ncbi:MAG: iron-sulfur cluster assembly scaffold protein [Deltaproteobacteria bacterium]|nr:iron-sulfur cluster assembly scaffold protein [Deltaproteobacteria bacterium]